MSRSHQVLLQVEGAITFDKVENGKNHVHILHARQEVAESMVLSMLLEEDLADRIFVNLEEVDELVELRCDRVKAELVCFVLCQVIQWEALSLRSFGSPRIHLLQTLQGDPTYGLSALIAFGWRQKCVLTRESRRR